MIIHGGGQNKIIFPNREWVKDDLKCMNENMNEIKQEEWKVECVDGIKFWKRKIPEEKSQSPNTAHQNRPSGDTESRIRDPTGRPMTGLETKGYSIRTLKTRQIWQN